MSFTFIFVVVAALIVGIIGIAMIPPKISVDDLDDDEAGRCVACGSADLDREAPGLYRCRACGFEGGAARASLERHQTQAAWARRPWPERRDAAASDLEDARLALLALRGDLKILVAFLEAYDGPFMELLKMALHDATPLLVDVLQHVRNPGPARPELPLVQTAYDEILEESTRIWGSLLRAAEKVPQLEAGEAPTLTSCDLAHTAELQETLSSALHTFEALSERLQREQKRLQVLDPS